MYHHIENTPVMTQIREGRSFVRSMAAFVLIVFTFVTYSPAALALVNANDGRPTKNAREEYNIERNFDQLETLLTSLNATLSQGNSAKEVAGLKPWSGITAHFGEDSLAQERLQLRALWKQVENSQREKLQEAKDTLTGLKSKLPENKQKKRLDQIGLAEQNIDKMDSYMAGIDSAASHEQLKHNTYAALKHLLDTRTKPATHTFDAGQMPFGVDSDATRSPYTTAEQLHNYLGLQLDPDFNPATEGVNLVTDLRATTDVQITPDIRSLAQQLNRSPTAIYNWVYNNIQFVPSFGSIQGSDLTLANRQGNAFDIASLLIALLRASNVPARYVYGTVVMSADEMKNWVGGVDDVESARVLLGQGGIPGSAISDGGRYERIRFEHVWVEAYGVFNDENRLRWNAMDAAFKQYQFTEGVDLLEEVGFDKQGFANLVTNAGQSDASNNWIANVDTTAIQAEMERYQEALTTYLQNQPADTTLSEIIGGKRIIQRDGMEPVGPLPYQSHVRTRSFATLPDHLRHYFYVDLAPAPGFGMGALGGKPTPFMSYRASLPDLAGKRLSLSFRPASDADAEILQSLIGNVQSEADLPASIEAGLFDVVAEITLDGQVVSNSGNRVIGFGEQLTTNKGFVDPRFGYRETTSPIVAGDFQAIGLNIQGITSAQLAKAKGDLIKINSHEFEMNFDNLSKHDSVGVILHGAILSYFSVVDLVTKVAASTNNLAHYRLSSFGTYTASGSLIQVWGLASQVRFGSVAMDVDWLMSSNEGRVNCWQDWVSFNYLSGHVASSFEHIISEEIFYDGEPQASFSAVKALELAVRQGQRIYRIDSNTIREILPLVNVDSRVRGDIASAVSGGMVAIIHEAPLDVGDYRGFGYILLDPETGSGAYKISGGQNGGLILQYLRTTLLFMLGLWKWFSASHPLTTKAITGSLGLLAGGVSRIIKLLEACSGIEAVAGVLITLGWNILFLIANMSLIASGVGAVWLMPLSAVEFWLEKLFVDRFIESSCHAR